MLSRRKIHLFKLSQENVRALLALAFVICSFIFGLVICMALIFIPGINDEKIIKTLLVVFAFFNNTTSMLIGYYIANKGN